MHSFCLVTKQEQWIFPEIGENTNVIAHRHPILRKLSPKVVSNDVILPSFKTGMFITGPNLTGKSTYLTGFAITQLLFQMGCGAAAETGSKFRIYDETRGLSGEPKYGKRLKLPLSSVSPIIQRIFSDFMTIQKEFIQLEQVTFNNTLIIMDELLRVSPTNIVIKIGVLNSLFDWLQISMPI